MKIKLGVLFGGESVEHEISVISAVQAMEYIDKEKYDVIPIYISKDRTWYTGKMLMEIDVYKDFEDLKGYATKVTLYKKDGGYYLQSLGLFKKIVEEIDIIFPIVHGANVEDGSIAGYLDTVGVPYVGSRVLGSALGQDKVIMKQVFEANEIPISSYIWFFDNEYEEDSNQIAKRVKKLDYPVIVKPASLGSSIGITVVRDEKKLDDAIRTAISYDNKVVIEKMVSDLVELNCSVIGNYEIQTTSFIEEVLGKEEFLTYQEKYIDGGKKTGKSKGMASASRIIPAKIDSKIENEIKDLSKKVFKLLNLSGICRIDFLVDKKQNKVYVNEPNTIPGSLAFYLWEPAGKKYSELLDEAITMAIRDYKNRAKKTFSFETNVLSNFGGAKGLKGMKGKLNK